jgi:hypothetical protein
MALTINNFCGFETGGGEELVGGSPSFETTIVRTGTYSAQLDDFPDIDPFDGAADAGNNYILTFWFYPVDITAASRAILRCEEGLTNILELGYTTAGALEVVDANSDSVGIGGSLNEGAWNRIDLYWEHSAIGVLDVILNEVSVISSASEDFTAGGTFDNYGFRNIPEVAYIDDVICMSGATAASDRLSDAEVFGFQNAKGASATPDAGLSGSAGGNLNTGTWDKVAQTPLVNSAGNLGIYTSAGRGTVDSAQLDAGGDIDGDSNIKAIKGIWNAKRGTGGGASHYAGLGDSGDGNSPAVTADLGLTTVYVNHFVLRETDLPAANQKIRQGFETTGAQDFDCGDMWAMILHVPSVGAANPKGPLGMPLHGPLGGPV